MIDGQRLALRDVPLHQSRWLIALLSLLWILQGCAGLSAYREGNALIASGREEEGLIRLQDAVRQDPASPEYRIGFATRKASIVARWVAEAEVARRGRRLDEAAALTDRILRVDPSSSMGRQLAASVAQDRRHGPLVQEASSLISAQGEGWAEAAALRLSTVLSEDPSNRLARELQARIVARSADQSDRRLGASFRKPVTLQFRDAPIRSVLDFLGQAVGLSFFVDRDVPADLRVTVQVRDSSVEDVLQLIGSTHQLRHKVLNETTVLVFGSSAAKAREFESQIVRAFLLTNADTKSVAATLRTILRIQDMVVDERLSMIIMRDSPEVVRMAERIVAMQDLSDPEVMLEVEILEVKRSRLLELGIQWPGQLSLSPLQSSSAPLTLQALREISSATTQATVGSLTANARREDQDVNLLANPRIRVRNRDRAKVMIGDRVPVITTTSTATGFVAESVNYVDVGLKLEVEPTIYLAEEVAIKVGLEVSSVTKEVLSKAGTLSYQIGSRSAATVLRLKDGETQILAGLISDDSRSTASRVPGVGELPGLGRLFGSQKDDSQRSEILLSITPRIVRSIQRPDALAAEFDLGTGAAISSRPMSVAPPTAPLGMPGSSAGDPGFPPPANQRSGSVQ